MRRVDHLELLRASERAADNAAAASYPSDMLFPTFDSASANGEIYRLKTTGTPNKIILYLHSWTADLGQIATDANMAVLTTIRDSIIIAPNFGGPNNTAGALGSQDSTDRIARVISEVRYKTKLTRVYLVGPSGGGMAALLLLGRYPDLVYRASIWVPIFDLASLYATTSNQQLKTDMLTVLGSAPNGPDDPRYLCRSPRSCLQNYNGRATVFINVGTQDTEVPPVNGDNACTMMRNACPGSNVKLVEWNMGHQFKANEALEAMKQLILE